MYQKKISNNTRLHSDIELNVPVVSERMYLRLSDRGDFISKNLRIINNLQYEGVKLSVHENSEGWVTREVQ